MPTLISETALFGLFVMFPEVMMSVGTEVMAVVRVMSTSHFVMWPMMAVMGSRAISKGMMSMSMTIGTVSVTKVRSEG